MTAADAPEQSTRVFIGERIEHASDAGALSAVHQALEARVEWAYIFANFHVRGRQIDLAVFTATTTLVIEAKQYSQPVQGGVNGNWVQIGPYGTRNLRNGYAQALDAKNALRDAIAGVFGPVPGYPNALLAVVPQPPLGSSLPSSDFKVSVGGLDAARDALTKSSGALLSRAQCEAFATSLKLEAVSGPDAAIEEEVLGAERSLASYQSAFQAFHGPLGSRLLEDQYWLDDSPVDAVKVRNVALESRAAVLICGPSGCGKSLLSSSIATQGLQEGVLPIHIQGKDFEGKLQKAIDAELGLLGVTWRDMLRMSRILDKQLVLFLDGYNECPEPLRTTLTRSLRAFSLRYGAGIVISSQEALYRQELLAVEEVEVHSPSLALKSRLAGLRAGDGNFASCQALLEVVTSGFEADLIGQAAASLPAGASKFVLFDTVARLRLGDAAVAGISTLSAFAEELMNRAAFSLSVREFDRLAGALEVTDATRRAIHGSRLVLQRGDRLSFSHEMFLSAFAAESAIRTANKDSTRLEVTLRSPRFHLSKALIVGAIEDETLLEAILNGTTDQSLLESCVQGECGEAAQRIVTTKIKEQLAEMVAEPADLRFFLNGEGWNSSAIESATPRPRLARFGAHLPAVGWMLMQGLHIGEAMAACRAMEQKIVEANRDLYEEARAKMVPLRHETFGQAYLFNRRVAISQLMNFVHSGGLSFRHKPGPAFEAPLKKAWNEARTHSEFYLLLALSRFTDHAVWAAPFVADLLERLKTLPYHLQLDAMNFCIYMKNVEETDRVRMINALESCLDKLGVMMNSMIVEALKGLGALGVEADDYVAVVKSEIDHALLEDSPEADAEAWSLFSRQFDHPFDGTYWEEIHDLDDERRKTLLFKACRGAGTEYVSFVGILIRQLSDFGDPGVASAIEPWLRIPSKTSVMPQDAVEAFFAAHEAFGKLNVPLPAMLKSLLDVDEAMRACGELSYWACRLSASELESSPDTLEARTVLLAGSGSISAGALLSSTSRMLSSDGTRTHLAKNYPTLSLGICREALQRRDSQKSYLQHGFMDGTAEIAMFSLQVIGEYGDADDLKSLRAVCDDDRLGREALSAIKKIEDRVKYRNP